MPKLPDAEEEREFKARLLVSFQPLDASLALEYAPLCSATTAAVKPAALPRGLLYPRRACPRMPSASFPRGCPGAGAAPGRASKALQREDGGRTAARGGAGRRGCAKTEPARAAVDAGVCRHLFKGASPCPYTTLHRVSVVWQCVCSICKIYHSISIFIVSFSSFFLPDLLSPTRLRFSLSSYLSLSPPRPLPSPHRYGHDGLAEFDSSPQLPSPAAAAAAAGAARPQHVRDKEEAEGRPPEDRWLSKFQVGARARARTLVLRVYDLNLVSFQSK